MTEPKVFKSGQLKKALGLKQQQLDYIRNNGAPATEPPPEGGKGHTWDALGAIKVGIIAYLFHREHVPIVNAKGDDPRRQVAAWIAENQILPRLDAILEGEGLWLVVLSQNVLGVFNGPPKGKPGKSDYKFVALHEINSIYVPPVSVQPVLDNLPFRTKSVRLICVSDLVWYLVEVLGIDPKRDLAGLESALIPPTPLIPEIRSVLERLILDGDIQMKPEVGQRYGLDLSVFGEISK